jgi:hypothetical protein
MALVLVDMMNILFVILFVVLVWALIFICEHSGLVTAWRKETKKFLLSLFKLPHPRMFYFIVLAPPSFGESFNQIIK